MHTMIKLNYTNIALLLQEATQKYQKLRLLNKMLLSLSVLPSAYCDLRLLHLPQQQRFSVLVHSTPQILNVTSDHCAIYSFVFCFEYGFLQVKPT